MEKYKIKILKSFDAKSSSYDQYSFVQKEVSERMIQRLKFLKSKPLNILDIGCGTGYLSNLINQYLPNSNIVCMDFSYEMASQCKNKNIKLEPLVADAEYMPFKTSTFDLVISSFTLHWCQQIDKIFSDIFRILKNDGNFMFTTVGPDTLKELRDAYKLIDNYEHINTFDDMHTYGDILLSSGFHDPVMDIERLIIEYKNFNEVLQSLRKTGASTVIYNENKFTTKKSLKDLENHYKKSNKNGLFPVTYEMIYGVAWKKGTQNPKNNEDVIPIKIID